MKKPYNYDVQQNLHAIHDKDMKLVVGDDYLSYIEGRILTLVEALLPNMEKQKHDSVKSLVSGAIWDDLHNGWACPMTEDKWDELVLELTGPPIG